MNKLITWTALLLLSAAAAQAGIIYNNGGPNTANGYTIFGSVYVDDDFTLTGNSVVTGVGFYFQNTNGISGWNHDIQYAIRGDSGTNLPGSVIQTGTAQNVTATDSGQPWCCGGGNAFLVTFDLANSFSAAGGVRYWLELTGASGGTTAYWVSANPNASALGVSNGVNVTDYQFAFYLTDSSPTVPEAGSFSMLVIGALAVGWGIRRFR